MQYDANSLAPKSRHEAKLFDYTSGFKDLINFYMTSWFLKYLKWTECNIKTQ